MGSEEIMASPEAVWLVDGKAGCERAGSSLGCVGSACVYVKGEERGGRRAERGCEKGNEAAVFFTGRRVRWQPGREGPSCPLPPQLKMASGGRECLQLPGVPVRASRGPQGHWGEKQTFLTASPWHPSPFLKLLILGRQN